MPNPQLSTITVGPLRHSPGLDPYGRDHVISVYNEDNEIIGEARGATKEEASAHARACMHGPAIAEALRQMVRSFEELGAPANTMYHNAKQALKDLEGRV